MSPEPEFVQKLDDCQTLPNRAKVGTHFDSFVKIVLRRLKLYPLFNLKKGSMR